MKEVVTGKNERKQLLMHVGEQRSSSWTKYHELDLSSDDDDAEQNQEVKETRLSCTCAVHLVAFNHFTRRRHT